MNTMKRKSTAPKNSPGLLATTLISLFTISGVAFLIASLFTAAKPINPFSGDFSARIAEALKEQEPTPDDLQWPTATPRPRPHIGIVVGHWGDDADPGAVCPDGLTELSINQVIAGELEKKLLEAGFDVDMMYEFDDRLNDYTGIALISIHADSCTYINDVATGFKVAASQGNPRLERTARLVACLRTRYAAATGLTEHLSITGDMSEYHAFEEINNETPAVIIETGFMNLDRQILTQDEDLIAQGIADGLVCYVQNESITIPADE
jgi:N-acetylmuramoyl-L-alanine amidase